MDSHLSSVEHSANLGQVWEREWGWRSPAGEGNTLVLLRPGIMAAHTPGLESSGFLSVNWSHPLQKLKHTPRESHRAARMCKLAEEDSGAEGHSDGTLDMTAGVRA